MVLGGAGAVATLVLNGGAKALGAEIGLIADVVNFAYGAKNGVARAELDPDDPVFFEETIETGDESAADIRFIDGSVLTVGENSTVVIDAFVFDPATLAGNSTISLTKGVFRYVSGDMPKENVEITTPTITIGIRGTELLISVAGDGGTEMSTVTGEALCTTRRTRRQLRVLARQSARTLATGVWDGGVRNFIHRIASPAVRDGLGAARRAWRIRRRNRRRIRRERNEPR